MIECLLFFFLKIFWLWRTFFPPISEEALPSVIFYFT